VDAATAALKNWKQKDALPLDQIWDWCTDLFFICNF
jgi:hypothetical protein